MQSLIKQGTDLVGQNKLYFEGWKGCKTKLEQISMVPCGSNTIYSVKIKTGDQKGKSVRVYASSVGRISKER